MQELDKALALSVPEPLYGEAVAACRRQVAAWGVALPDVPPLVLDFGLGDFARHGLVEFWIANELEAGYCGKYLFLFDGQTCPRHHHREKLETFFIVHGRVRMDYHGAERILEPGAVLRVEPGHPHRFRGEGPALMLEVSKPCVVDDNYFEDPRVPYGGGRTPGAGLANAGPPSGS